MQHDADREDIVKKILNDPYSYAEETLQGLCRAYPQFYRMAPDTNRVIVRPDGPIKGKVGIVSGGGSGHLPIFTGYVGPGLPRRGGLRRRVRLAVGRGDGDRHARGQWRCGRRCASTAITAATS